MKVLIDSACKRCGEGIASSLFWIEEMEVMMWLSHIKPTMDMFDETKPDIVIAPYEKFATQEMSIAASRYPNARLVAIGQPSETEGGAEPHLIVAKGPTEGIPSIEFEEGAIIGNLGRPSKQEHLKADLLCMTDGIEDHQKANPILDFLCENYNIKIFGNQKVNFPNYLGSIDKTTYAEALASTMVYVDLDGASWHDAAWLGKQCVSVSKSCFRSFDDIEGLKVAIDEALKSKEEESAQIKMAMKNKTYFELTSEILLFFGLGDYRKKLIEKKREITC